jgi:uncharacterized protein YlaN (UPF0358 family)
MDKLNDATVKASETQSRIEAAVRCGFIEEKTGKKLHATYDKIADKIADFLTQE